MSDALEGTSQTYTGWGVFVGSSEVNVEKA